MWLAYLCVHPVSWHHDEQSVHPHMPTWHTLGNPPHTVLCCPQNAKPPASYRQEGQSELPSPEPHLSQKLLPPPPPASHQSSHLNPHRSHTASRAIIRHISMRACCNHLRAPADDGQDRTGVRKAAEHCLRGRPQHALQDSAVCRLTVNSLKGACD